MAVTKAVIPVAGWGTRMLPITKAIEKCMLPIGTRPIIDFIVQDVLAAGITEIIFVVGEQSTQLKNFYTTNQQLEAYLKRQNKSDKLPLVAPLEGVTMQFVVQPGDGAYGTSVPVGLVNEYIADDEQALVIMGDQFFLRRDGGSNAADLIKLVEESGQRAGLLGVPVPETEVSNYGIIEKDEYNNFVQIVEKPRPEDAPSNLNNASFYLFDKPLFELVQTVPVNPIRGEFEITDVINAYVASGNAVVVGAAQGEYLDGGSLNGWLHANAVVAG